MSVDGTVDERQPERYCADRQQRLASPFQSLAGAAGKPARVELSFICDRGDQEGGFEEPRALIDDRATKVPDRQQRASPLRRSTDSAQHRGDDDGDDVRQERESGIADRKDEREEAERKGREAEAEP